MSMVELRSEGNNRSFLSGLFRNDYRPTHVQDVSYLLFQKIYSAHRHNVVLLLLLLSVVIRTLIVLQPHTARVDSEQTGAVLVAV